MNEAVIIKVSENLLHISVRVVVVDKMKPVRGSSRASTRRPNGAGRAGKRLQQVRLNHYFLFWLCFTSRLHDALPAQNK